MRLTKSATICLLQAVYEVIVCTMITFGFAAHQAQAQTHNAPEDSIHASTLKDLEEEAIVYNLSLLSQRLEYAQSRSDVVTAELRPNPALNLNGDMFPLPGERFSPDDKQYAMSLQVPFELGGKRGYRIEMAEQISKTAQLQVANGIRQVLFGLRLSYFDVLAAEEALKIADINLDSFRRVASLNESRYQAKQISASELSRTVIAQSQAELQREEALLNLRKAREAFIVVLGRRRKVVMKDSLTILPRAFEPLENLEQIALQRRPDLLAARSLNQSSEANVRLQDANAVIDLGLSLDYSKQQGVNLYGLSAQVPIPFFNRNQGEREKARFKLEQAQRQIELAELSIIADVRTAQAEYETREKALEKFHTNGKDGILARAAGMKETAEFAYKNGSISLLELLDAVRTYTDIYKSYIDAVALYNKSIATLDAATALDPIRIEN